MPPRSYSTTTWRMSPSITPSDGMILKAKDLAVRPALRKQRSALGQRLRELRRHAKPAGQRARGVVVVAAVEGQQDRERQADAHRRRHPGVDSSHWHEHETAALLASLHTLEVQHAEWQRILKVGLAGHQLELSEQDAKTRLYRSFRAGGGPRTSSDRRVCSRALLTGGSRCTRCPTTSTRPWPAGCSVRRCCTARIKAFHFIITEGTLRNRVCSVDVLLGQLDRLVSLTSLRNVRLGVIAYETEFLADPRHSFMLYNSDLVRVETYSAELNLRQPHEIEFYGGIFERHAAVASYGASARGIINRAIRDLTPAIPERTNSGWLDLAPMHTVVDLASNAEQICFQLLSILPTLPVDAVVASVPTTSWRSQVSARVALLTRDQIDRLPPRARDVLEYRKSGLSLNHIQGCPLTAPTASDTPTACGIRRVPRHS